MPAYRKRPRRTDVSLGTSLHARADSRADGPVAAPVDAPANLRSQPDRGAGPARADRHAVLGPPKPPARTASTRNPDELSITLAGFVTRYPVSRRVDQAIRRAASRRVPAVLTPIRRLPRNYIAWCHALGEEIPGLPTRAVQQLVIALSTFLARHPDPGGATRALPGDPSGASAAMPPVAFQRLAIEALTPAERRVFETRAGIRVHRTLPQLAAETDTHVERVRALDKQARHTLRALGIRHDVWRILDSAFPASWPRLCAGAVSYTPARSAPPPLDPPMLYLCAAAGGFESCLSHYCAQVHKRWLLKTDASDTVRQRALMLRAELLEEWRLPQPLSRLARRLDLSERDIEVLLQHGDRPRCTHGYVVAASRPSRHLVLDAALREAGTPLAVAELRDRLVKRHQGPMHDMHRLLGAAPHLFLRIWAHQWCSLTELPSRLRDTPHDDLGSLEPFGPDDRSVRQALLRLVRDRGPLTWSELRQALSPDARSGIPRAVTSLPDLVKCAPGIYGYRGDLESDTGNPPRAFFREAQATAFALGRRAGLPPSFYPFWTARNEMALCNWAREEASTGTYQTLVAHAEPRDWPDLDAAAVAFWLRERDRCSFTLEPGRNTSFDGAFPASRLVAALLVGTLQGRISWMEANRCLGARINARSGLLVVSLLAMMGTIEPDPDWRRPHSVRGDHALATLAQLLEPLTRTGRLRWECVEPWIEASDHPGAEWIRPGVVGSFLSRVRRLDR